MTLQSLLARFGQIAKDEKTPAIADREVVFRVRSGKLTQWYRVTGVMASAIDVTAIDSKIGRATELIVEAFRTELSK